MSRLRLRRQLRDAYRFPGFVPLPIIRGTFGDPHARVVSLKRREKKQPAAFVVDGTEVTTMPGFKWCETYPVAAYASTWRWKCGAWWCKRDYPPTTPIARVSPCRNSHRTICVLCRTPLSCGDDQGCG